MEVNSMKMNNILLAIALIITMSCESRSQFTDEFVTKDIATGLDTPWEILWGPDDYIWMTERYGRISRVNPNTGEVSEIYRIQEVTEGGEKGLMGMALHPDFQNFPYVYVVFNYQQNENALIRVDRYTYNGTILEPASRESIIRDIPGAQIHDGSRLWIDENLKLFVTTGDAGNAALSQDLNSINGKTLRINLDGTIPEDNPFPDSPIWSWGHRNAQGMVMHNGIMYQSEHGPSNDDEVNIILMDRNYGWPNVHGFCDDPSEEKFCQDSNVVEPIAAWTPTLAVAGIDFYDKSLFPDFENSLLLVSLKAGKMVQLKLAEDRMSVVLQNQYFNGIYGRLRDICISPDGKIYIATSNKDGRGAPAPQDDRIIELTPSSSSVQQNIVNSSEIQIFPNPVTDKLMVLFTLEISSDSDLRIIDNLGKTIFSITDLVKNNIRQGMEIEINEIPNALSAGIYHIVIRNGEKFFRESIIIE
jgi:glucose/arabinose dehydrogenase